MAILVGGGVGFLSTRDFSGVVAPGGSPVSNASPASRSSLVSYPSKISACRVVDGDTLRCGGERIRLIGIDAPEMGECRPGRNCVDGDPVASKRSLAGMLDGDLTINRVGKDHYGRTLALVANGQGDLSCQQVERGHAIYKPRWDEGDRLAKACPGIA